MIKREQILDVVKCVFDTGNSVNDVTDDLMALITEHDKERDEQYRELVEKSVAFYLELKGHSILYTINGDNFSEAVQPFIPPKPSLSERLDNMLGEYRRGIAFPTSELDSVISEIKELEDKLKIEESGND